MELAYINNSNSLFRKYAFLLHNLVRHQAFRDRFTINGFELSKNTILLLPNGFVDYLGKKQFRSTFSTRAYNSPILYQTLEKLDIVSSYISNIKEAEIFIMNDLGLIRKRFDFPQIYLSDTFNPDANPESTSVDGRVYRGVVNETFGTIRAGVGSAGDDTFSSDLNIQVKGSGTSNQWAVLLRSFFLFDTSSIPDGDIVSAATFSLYVTAKTTNITDSVGLLQSNPASNTAIIASDYQGFTQTTRQTNSDLTISGMTTSAYNDWVLNNTGISNVSKTGITKLGIKTASDIDNSAPSWVNGASGDFTANQADAGSNKPKLVVTHSATGGALIINFI